MYSSASSVSERQPTHAASAAPAAAAAGGPAVLVEDELASLYMERLREYNDLAAHYDTTYKDTVEDAEKNGGVIEVNRMQ